MLLRFLPKKQVPGQFCTDFGKIKKVYNEAMGDKERGW